MAAVTGLRGLLRDLGPLVRARLERAGARAALDGMRTALRNADVEIARLQCIARGAIDEAYVLKARIAELEEERAQLVTEVERERACARRRAAS